MWRLNSAIRNSVVTSEVMATQDPVSKGVTGCGNVAQVQIFLSKAKAERGVGK